MTHTFSHTRMHRARGNAGEETEEDFDHRTEHIQALNQRGQPVMRRREESAQGGREGRREGKREEGVGWVGEERDRVVF